MKLVLILAGLLLIPSVIAIPDITSADTIVNDGQQISIIGTGFGTNPQANEAAFLGGINGWTANQQAGSYLTTHTPFSTAPNTEFEYIYPGSGEGRGIEDRVSNLNQRVPGKNTLRIRTGTSTPSGTYTSSFGLSTPNPNQDFFISFWANINPDVTNFGIIQCDHPDVFGGSRDGQVCLPQIKFFSYSPYANGFYGSNRNQGIVISRIRPDINNNPTMDGFFTEWDSYNPSSYAGQSYDICGIQRTIWAGGVPYIYATAPYGGGYNGQSCGPSDWQLHSAGDGNLPPYAPPFNEWFKVQISVKGGEYRQWDGMYKWQQLWNGQNMNLVDLQNINMFSDSLSDGDFGDPTYPARFWFYHYFGQSCQYYYGPTNADGTPRDPAAYNYYPVEGQCSGSSGGDWSTYVDDFYVQPGSIAHIEIGNNQFYDQTTQLEIQKPVVWNDNTLSFEINYGTFTQGQQVYLFVVDSNGDASDGFPIILGDIPDGPFITSVSDNNPADDSLLTIYGMNFGTHTNAIEWMGGINGPLETMPEGASMRKVVDPIDPLWTASGWVGGVGNQPYELGGGNDPTISGIQAHSGSQSLYHTAGGVGYASTSLYNPGIDTDPNMPDVSNKVFASAWIYFNPYYFDDTGNTFWKIMNIKHGQGTPCCSEGELFIEAHWFNDFTIGDGVPRLYAVHSSRRTVGCVYPCSSPLTCSYCALPGPPANSGVSDTYYYGSADTNGPTTPPPYESFEWMRLDWWVDASSDFDTWDGVTNLRLTIPSSGTNYEWELDGIATHGADPLIPIDQNPGVPYWDLVYDSVMWKNQISNGLGVADIYIDDQYIQYGTQARIELCNNINYFSATHCELQKPDSWNIDSVAINVNYGSFTNETTYLFVIDENGNVSNGFALILGSSGSPVTPPTIDCNNGENRTCDFTAQQCLGIEYCVGNFWSGICEDANPNDGCPILGTQVILQNGADFAGSPYNGETEAAIEAGWNCELCDNSYDDVGIINPSGDYARKKLIRFDLSGVDPSSVIVYASVELYEHNSYSATSDVKLTKLSKSWIPSGLTYNCTNDIDHNQCSGATDIPWEVKGAEGSTDRDGSSSIMIPVSDGWNTWDITNIAQDWVNNPSTNYGFILEEFSGVNYQAFYAGTYLTDISLRPKLTIIFTQASSNPYDLDGIVGVNIGDLLELASRFGTSGVGDYDNSGSITILDLIIHIRNWD